MLAARTIGARDLRLMFRHILPNAAGPIIVNATLLVGTNIILESIMSFFGFGIRAPTASWGNMVADGQAYFDKAPGWCLHPRSSSLLQYSALIWWAMVYVTRLTPI